MPSLRVLRYSSMVTRNILKAVMLLGLPVCAYSETLLITGGSVSLFGAGGMVWWFVGDGFTAHGAAETYPLECFCVAPFQLLNPLPFPIDAGNGGLTLGQNSYVIPVYPPIGCLICLVPFASGSVFLTPDGTLPTVTAAGTYDVPFDVGGSFCLTPPTPPDPACFSVIGTAVAHYTVIEVIGTNHFFQRIPTFEILAPVPEPGTLDSGAFIILLMLLAKCCRKEEGRL